MSPHTRGSTYFDNSDIYLRYGSIFGGGDTEAKGIFLLQEGCAKYQRCRETNLL
jgi:hypothetical protein